MKKLLPYVLAFHAALAAAILLWALQEKFPGPLTNTLSPIWNSPWEMGKAAFFPLLAAAPTLWVLQKGGSRGVMDCSPIQFLNTPFPKVVVF